MFSPVSNTRLAGPAAKAGRRSLAAGAAQLVAPTPADAPNVSMPVRPAVKRTLQNRVVVSRRKAPVDTLWYRLKAWAAGILCNLPIPRFSARRVENEAPFLLKLKLRKGDVLLRRTEGTSGNLFIPSWWKHAAVYIGHGKVAEATFAGVKIHDLDEFFAHGDHVMALRAKDLSRSQRAGVARYAKLQEGKPYDFDMDFDDDSRLSCTELAYHALEAGSGKKLIGKDWLGAVVGDDFKANPNLEVIYTSTPEQT